LIYHEIALAVTALALLAISWGHPNPVAGWTFLILFVCRLSAKLNLFFGVPHFSDSILPEHLQHLKSYLAKRAMTPLLPVSIVAGSVLAGHAAFRALAPEATSFEVTAFALTFALTALALIEHLFMIVPLPDATLWTWALPASERLRRNPFKLSPEKAPPLAK
jgi:putative photosynthetic complex assembly protein 2